MPRTIIGSVGTARTHRPRSAVSSRSCSWTSRGFYRAGRGARPRGRSQHPVALLRPGAAVVLRYGGTLEKFIGDAVMAVWGASLRTRTTPFALPGRRWRWSRRGCVAPTPERRLSARAAVATGEAVVTLGAEGEGMVAGDLVNTAARLQTVAPTGGVLVDEVTHRLATDAIEFEPTEPQMLKGKTRTIATWRAVAVVARPRRRPGGRPLRAIHRSLPRAGRAHRPPATDDHRPTQPARVGGRHRGHRQEPPHLGVRASPRRVARQRRAARRPRSLLWRRHHVRPDRGDGPASRSDQRGNADRGRTATARCRARRAGARRSRTAVDRAPRGIAAGPGRRPHLRARRALRRVAPFLRAGRRLDAGAAGLRGPAMGRFKPARLHRPSHDLVA